MVKIDFKMQLLLKAVWVSFAIFDGIIIENLRSRFSFILAKFDEER